MDGPENKPDGQSIATGPEFEYYHKQLLELPPEKFAVIKVGGATVRDDLDKLAADLDELSKLGLYPVIVHGAGPQISEDLHSRGITPHMKNGLRVTDEATLQSVQHGLDEVNDTLVQALTDRRVSATGIKSGVFSASLKDEGRLGRVGVVSGVNNDPIDQAIHEKSIPIVSCIGTDSVGNLLNINGDTASSALAADRQPHRYIALSDVPGVKDEQGQVINVINDPDEAEELIENGTINDGMIPKVREGFELLSKLGNDSSVVITSPNQLLRELFTYRGDGTLLRHGDAIIQLPTLNAVDQQQVRQLIESAFDKRLADDYFEQLPETAEVFVTDREYMGLAVVIPGEEKDGRKQAAYMDKLVVRPEAMGLGIGDEINRQVWEKHPEGLYWRVHKRNPMMSWYESKGLGQKYDYNEDWAVFFIGVQDQDKPYYAQLAAHRSVTVLPK